MVNRCLKCCPYNKTKKMSIIDIDNSIVNNIAENINYVKLSPKDYNKLLYLLASKDVMGLVEFKVYYDLNCS